MTIRELANRVGIGESALQALIKSGKTNTCTLEKIANQLDVSPGYFFENSKTGNIHVEHSSSVIANSGISGDNTNKNKIIDEMVEILKKKDEQIDKLLHIIQINK